MSEGKYSDSHLIYAVTGYATSEQIAQSIEKLLSSIGWSNPKPNMRINVVTAAGDEMTEYSYIWVSSPKLFQLLTKTSEITYEVSYQYAIKYKYTSGDLNLIKQIIDTGISDCKEYLYDTYDYDESCNYNIHPVADCFDQYVYVSLDSEAIYNILIGNNPDGTVREEVCIEGDDDTDDWGAGEMVTKKLQPLVSLKMIEDVNMQIEEYGNEVPKKYLEKRGKLKFDESLILPPIVYTKSQIEKILLLHPDRKEFIHQISMSPACIPYPDETQYKKNELIAFNVPEWVTIRIIKDKFKDYVTDKTAKFNDGYKICTYPVIYRKQTSKNTIIITVKFNENSNDGLVANKMSRKLRIESEDGKHSDVLRFDYNKVYNKSSKH